MQVELRALTTVLIGLTYIHCISNFIPPAAALRPHLILAMSASSSGPDGYVLVQSYPNKILELHLNRPKQLNALSLEMLQDITVHLERAIREPYIEGLLITANGDKAFSAGGDIKQILTGRLTEGIEGCSPEAYIRAEYQMDALIYKLSSLRKPVVAICDGIVMGGGAGIFEGAGIRVVTPKALFAMPEARIALLPDAGAQYFLHRAPGQIALYLALTGARIGGLDMLYAGLATHMVESQNIPSLIDRLRKCAKAEEMEKEVNSSLSKRSADQSELAQRRTLIDQMFCHSAVRQIYDCLVSHGDSGVTWIEAARQALERECPASHVLTLHAIRTGQRAGEHWSIEQGLGMEYEAIAGCLGYRADFVEGVETAVGLRRGEVPRWTLSRWEEVEEEEGMKQVMQRMNTCRTLLEVLQDGSLK